MTSHLISEEASLMLSLYSSGLSSLNFAHVLLVLGLGWGGLMLLGTEAGSSSPNKSTVSLDFLSALD